MLLQAVNNLFNACSDQDVAMLWGQHSTTQVINLFPVVRTMLFPVVRTMLFQVVETTMLFLVVGTMLFPVDESTSMNNAVRTTKINMITVMFLLLTTWRLGAILSKQLVSHVSYKGKICKYFTCC